MGDRDDILADLRERAHYYASLTSIGLPRRERAPAEPAAAPATSDSASDLRSIREWIGDCQRCKLARGRKTIVFGQGSPNAELMFIGEAPGAEEDEQGLAFVGKAGQLLTRIIEAIGRRREDVWIGNVLKCLRYDTTVLLEDGSWERIGRLVARRYSGKVMSVDESGYVVPKGVIGWYTSPLGERKVYKLSYASSRLRGGERAVTWLTEDHEVLTSRGWVQVRNLGPVDEVALGVGLSRTAHEVVTGSLLGDGSIPARQALLQMTHCRAQEEYVRLKAGALRELRPVIRDGSSRATKGGREQLTTQCRTRASRALRLFRNRFYPDGTKHVPGDLRLTPRSLAIWFLDDGYTKTKSDSSALSELAAHAFAGDGIGTLVDGLRDDLGLEGYIRASSPGRIQFGSEATLRLSEAVAPYCPPSLRYKLHPGVRERIAFHPSLYEPGLPETFFDRAVVERVECNGARRGFFCIDVEDTHNFVTSGGVVHNCRPPGNRNPEPDEILSCQPFLEKQIEAIRPKVIVALGKFAGQWVLKTAEPISRLRGRLGDYQGIPVMPTYHPAYLLRNPAGKKDVWADMKVVKALLEE